MTEHGNGYDIWTRNITALTETATQIAAEYARLAAESVADPASITGASRVWGEMCARMIARPDMWMKYYTAFWQEYSAAMSGQPSPAAADKRFQDEGWTQDAFFAAMKDVYYRSCRQAESWVDELAGGDAELRKQYDFYVRQYLDAVSPSNFPATNPAVMRAFLESKGESLLKGMRGLLDDMKASKGFLTIRHTPEHAFKLGENIAATPGDVIFKNYLMEVIRFTPAKAKIASVPLLLIPAWINKYYILDLSAQKSFADWLRKQGYDVYIISWVNPDASLKNVTFEDYLKDGALAALEAVKKAAGSDAVSAAGYCLGGTLLACLLAHLEKKGRAKDIASATFLTTLLDFSNAGDLSIFIDRERIQALEESMSVSGGVMEGRVMSNIFSLIRANDLIWNAFVNRYLLGKEPMPFDILFWNADSTNLPAAMHIYYLRNMYADNKLCIPNALSMAGTPVDLSAITVPCYFLATKDDHIAPWEAVFNSCRLLEKAAKTFVLAGSGHVAGVVNPPERKKYGYFAPKPAKNNAALPANPAEWLEQCSEKTGSWWEHWHAWQQSFAGKPVTPKPTEKPLYPAPGEYVLRSFAAASEAARNITDSVTA